MGSRHHELAYFATMESVVFTTGECFSSWNDVLRRKKQYEDNFNVHLWIRDSRTVEAAKKRAPQKAEKVNAAVKYFTATLCCRSGGRKFKSTSNGQRKSRTLRMDCPVKVHFRLTEDGQQLVVTQLISEHNHELGEECKNVFVEKSKEEMGKTLFYKDMHGLSTPHNEEENPEPVEEMLIKEDGLWELSSTHDLHSYETLTVLTPRANVFHVQINRPDKLNTMNKVFWREIKECFDKLTDDLDCRAVVLSGAGKIFTAGIDPDELAEMACIVISDDDLTQKGRTIQKIISSYQASFASLEKCPKPVIAAVHSACVGGGIDLICSADIRYCTSDAWFQVKEVDVGLGADAGTLQRLPKIIGNESLVRELSFTARKMFSNEALQCGLVSKIFGDKESMLAEALDMASTIASKSPVAVHTAKLALVYARDHSLQEGLEYVRTLNMSVLQSEDVRTAAMAQMS
ncbi:delta(3,5)-Delta(2,4)-dienoyl-CoA isomerase, mitochondrial-like [Panulirus ornatus]|uniref:delta(3,5)-Delta(2,4)-dienoyl-CoA isomerase, mitochondrial-like n=1 Tax=Panulirus ornatus TaxID=150431 RepID=UPI003A8410FF